MAARSSSPTLRRRRLAAALRQARRAAGLTTAQLAEACDLSQSTISRIENAEVGAQPNHVRAILAHLGVEQRRTDELIRLARQLRMKGWWHEVGDTVGDRYSTYIELETAANSVRTYEPSVVPGLLQIPEYARAVSATHPVDDPAVLDELVAVRQRRQQQLLRDDTPLRLHAVVDETALRRPYGDPDVLRAQLRHLAALATRPNITLQILPVEAPDQPAYTGPFVLLTFPAPEPPVVYQEGIRGDIYLEDTADLSWFSLLFDRLAALARSPHDTHDFITGLAIDTS